MTPPIELYDTLAVLLALTMLTLGGLWWWTGTQESRARRRHPRLVWSCSDMVSHEHRWRWTAWLCGLTQRWASRL